MILCIETNKVMKIINDIVNYAEPLICLVNRHPTVHIDWKFDADIPLLLVNAVTLAIYTYIR